MEHRKYTLFKLFMVLVFPFYLIARKYTKGFNRTYDTLLVVNTLYLALLLYMLIDFCLKSIIHLCNG